MDAWSRKIDYLRIAVTDRCNLRCFYCMPSQGITYKPKKELLTYEEILRLTRVFSSLGIKKIRLTGGEPFLRKDFISLVRNIKHTEGIDKVHITTNGVLTYPYLDQLQSIGVDGVNLSLDSLDKGNFYQITKRNDLDTVLRTLEGLIERNIHTKINTVVMHEKNTQEVLDMARLAKSHDISIRFIEEMPFNGSKKEPLRENWNYKRIEQELQHGFPDFKKINKTDPNAPVTLYEIPGYMGTIGIIPAYSRTFCHACNRIRLTATGSIKNCLYDEGVLDLKSLLRNGQSDASIRQIIIDTVQKKEKDGEVAEAKRKKSRFILESMSTIGG